MTETAVGTIWCTSWGYDQTNVEFFEVVRETAHSVVVRAIKSTVQDGRVYPLAGQWTTDLHLMGNPGTPTRERDEACGYSEKMCRKPGVGCDGYRFHSITIDECRDAYPYEGGGAYDTLAAGGMGH